MTISSLRAIINSNGRRELFKERKKEGVSRLQGRMRKRELLKTLRRKMATGYQPFPPVVI